MWESKVITILLRFFRMNIHLTHIHESMQRARLHSFSPSLLHPLTLSLLLLFIPPASGQKPAVAPKSTVQKKARSLQAEKITENTFRVGSSIIDIKARTITCPGEINMTEGSIEYLAVAAGGKTHESLLRLRVRPLHLQVALLMLDLEPKNILKRQGDPATPQGDPVEIRIRWKDSAGQIQERPIEEMILEATSGKPMPKHPWVFTGSRILKEGFEADLSKSLIAVYHDPAAILDNPHPGAVSNSYLVNSKKTPMQGTRIELVIRAVGQRRGEVGEGRKER